MLEKLPVPARFSGGPLRDRVLLLTREMDRMASELAALSAEEALSAGTELAAAIASAMEASIRPQRHDCGRA